MAEYFVGGGGNDGNTGLSWAQRFLTLGAAEALVGAADIVTPCANKVYREQVTLAASGGAGAEIVYRGDVTGQRTDGIGGIVRITGSNNDQTRTRQHCIDGNNKTHRIFRGFALDMPTDNCISTDGGATDWTVEDIVFQSPGTAGIYQLSATTGMDWIIRRCLFMSMRYAFFLHAGSATDAVNNLIENCRVVGMRENAILCNQQGDNIVRNLLSIGIGEEHIRVGNSPNAGHGMAVENSIFMAGGKTALSAATLGDIVEDYNTFSDNTADRFNVNVGANSQTYPALFLPPLLYSGVAQDSGHRFPWQFGALSPWSQVRAIAGNNEPAGDFFGTRRPATAAKNSWGPIQYPDWEVESGTVQAGTYGRVLHDAGAQMVRRIPVTGVQITVTLYVRREANYAGNLPRMIIKQPGAVDQITTSVAAVNTWEQLSDTFTPNALPGYVEVWLESRNTAGAGNYETFWDTMDVN